MVVVTASFRFVTDIRALFRHPCYPPHPTQRQNMVCKEQWSAIVYKQAKFLTLLAGRGYFYIFVGTRAALVPVVWWDRGVFDATPLPT